ncbi:ATP-dependent DNA helicase RecG [Cellulomonas marina]|nr:ATP-dependent DNA helicase RecG [Cellulomonas marina]GIG27605.1 ATP-dependent DNA helicase RecG [Cellulomonas marina]
MSLTQAAGKALVPRLERLGLGTVGDLLRHYPRRYLEPSTLTDIGALATGERVTIVADVERVQGPRRTRTGLFVLTASVTDGRDRLALTFFAKREGPLAYHAAQLVPGRRGTFSGQVSTWQDGRQLTHPTYEMLDDEQAEGRARERAGWPVPLYPLTAKLEQRHVRDLVHQELTGLGPSHFPDLLPDEVRARRGLLTWAETVHKVHEPHEEADWRAAHRRLRYQEAFVLQAELARRRARAAAEEAVARPPRAGGLLEAFDARLPFTLTAGQREVGAEIAAELARPVPMQRLLQGEVGSGKTVVALRAMLQVVDAGGQAALLAPTEVLAAQHARSLRAMLGDLAEGGLLGGAETATRVALLTGSASSAARRAALLEAASGQAGIVVGTHALLSDVVQFAELGLVVVDEQHRFGVEQRDRLRAKAGGHPHLLVMTATPIPRTVAMTVFGDLETSVLREVPAGRSGVQTHVVPAGRPTWLERTWRRVREEVDGGGRAYVVCARIDPDSEADRDADLVVDRAAPGDDAGDDALLDDDGGAPAEAPARPPLRAVLEVVEELRALPVLAGVPVGTLHGRMAPEDKERALADFASGRVPVLVSTTVVEVGVDVPEATVMVVLDADRFGVSQLHQLRGRIGRGSAPGVCLLVAQVEPGSPAATRLETLERTTDGFELATVDLGLRREGDVLGAAQSGASSSLRFLRVTRDAEVIEQARQDAREVVAEDPELERHPLLREAIEAELRGDRDEFLDRT